MRRFLILAWAGCLPLVVACNRGADATSERAADLPTGGVAVIDLDEVARRLGREGAIKQSLVAHETSLNQQLETLRVSYANQLQQRKEELPEQPARGDLAQVNAFEQQAVNRIQQARQHAQKDLLSQKRDLINAFREEVKPIASRVAATKGLNLVVSKNDTFLFAFDSAVDITQEVVAKMQATTISPAPSAAETPPVGRTNPPSPDSIREITGALSTDTTLPSPTEPGLLPAAPERPLRR
jgi:Skp family chaperone for outer membrane proteins